MDAITDGLMQGMKRFATVSMSIRVTVTAVLLTFAIYVSVAARKARDQPQQNYWVMVTKLWLGDNSQGVFLTLFYLWLFTYVLAAMWPTVVRLLKPIEVLAARYL